MADGSTPTHAPPGYVRRRGDLWAATGGLLVAAVCIVVVWGGELSAPERSVFLWINGLGDWLEPVLWPIQLVGSLMFVAGVAVVALATRRTRLGVAILAAIPVKLLVERWLVKALVERERPSLTVADAVVRESNSEVLGFPSGHAILAFALAGLLAPYLGRRGTILVFSVAALGAVARVYLAAHNPLDVVAGAAFGVMIAGVLNFAVGVPGGK